MNAKIIFGQSGSIGGRIIRLFTWSHWSHVAIIDGENVIEAEAFAGVRIVPLIDFLARYKRTKIVEFEHPDPAAFAAAARAQLGKGYDYAALVGFIFRRDWARAGRWFCSELVAWAFEASGLPLFRRELVRRITPQNLWMIEP